MHRRADLSVAALAALLLPAGWLLAGEVENPLKKAKVGDWVMYNTNTEMAGPMPMKTGGSMKQTVKAKDDKNVTLVMEMESQGQKMPAKEVQIPLDQPYDPAKVGGDTSGAKMETLGQGQETIEVGGKRYACQWVEQRFTVSQEGMQSVTTTKAWVCPDVPLGGMVKVVANSDTSAGGQSMKMTNTMELTGAGTAP